MGAGFPQMPSGNGYNAYPPSFLPGGGSQFSKTGVSGLNGGPSYPPGSDMTRFMDGLNNQIASVTSGPNGGGVVDWAKSLAAGAKKPLSAPQSESGKPQTPSTKSTGSAGSGAPSGGQLLAMMLEDLKEQAMLKLKGQGGNTKNQGEAGETSFGGKNGFCFNA